jgi:hypothetical protein
MPDFTEFDAQVIFYAKQWYKETTAIEDIRVLIAKISGMEVAHVSDLDVMQLVGGVMHKTVTGNFTYGDMEYLYKDLWRTNLFHAKKTITMNDMINSHLSVLRHQRVDNNQPLKDLLAKYPINNKYLPLN